jgi:GTP-binding protein
VATKVDGPRWEAHAHELAGLGFGEPMMCSATSNYMRRELFDWLYEITPEAERGEELAADLKIAIVGKRNAGKSSLVNALAGEPRVIVSEIAGTTRDAVDVRFELGGRSIIAIDTAGVRRKKSFADRIEWFAYDRAKRAIDRADVVLMLIDATEKVSQVDEQLAMLVQRAHKPVVVVVNKWDLVEGRAGPTGKLVTPEAYDEYLRKELVGLSFAPIALMSAVSGLNIRQTIALAFDLHEQAGRRVTTGQLNRLIRGILEQRGPPNKLGSQVKLLYVAQVSVHPPTIVMVVNRPELVQPNYERFLLNRFREALPFPEVPIRLVVRGRRRDGEMDMEQSVPAIAGTIPKDEELLLDAEAYFEDDLPEEP